ncbi:unnamed protein product [Brachionus calyciflorus]|uniref:Fork-head domain-containing protein n=1 Tax=Brachionus calyciflorus TaxID=104777 RepID=A0A813M4X3_9BILA|nr:unnamed protein product [Brachionus calyciflorus]
MNMDLMIDCMPYSSFGDKLCEMLEDDLKFISSLNASSSSSPSCTGDDDQLGANNFFDDFLFTPQQILNQDSNQNFDPLSSSLNTLDDTYNSIINSNSFNSYSFQSSSSSPLSSSTSISTVSSSAPSPLSLSASSSSLTAALASANFQSNNSTCSSTQSSPLCLSPNQFNNYQIDDFTLTTTQNNQNQKYIQDTFSSNNYNVFSVVNPMEINRNYSLENTNNNSQPQSQIIKVNTGVQLPTLVTTSRPTTTQISLNKNNFNNIQINQQNKRCKFTHNNNPSNFNLIKQEQIINSDGESIHSNESTDSNFSNSNNHTNFSINNTDFNQPKKVIITTKIEPVYHINTPTTGTQTSSSNQTANSPLILNSPQISVIKIPKENLETKTTSGLQLPINLPIGKTENSQNTKTIIQYKQYINGGNSATNSTATIKQIKNRQNSVTSPTANTNSAGQNGNATQVALRSDGKAYPKPPYSYSCLIAMSLRNSDSGTLPVSDIYEFIIENFPYYKTARDGWKNSIRHNLSLNKCFEKIENPTNGSKKGCLWALNPDKCKKLEEECKRCRQRDPVNIRLSMSRPDDLNKIERGEQRIKKYTAQRKLMESQQINSPTNNNNNTQQQSNNQLNDKNFLLEWKNVNIKEEELDYCIDDLGNTDIKFDPAILSRANQTVRSNIQ